MGSEGSYFNDVCLSHRAKQRCKCNFGHPNLIFDPFVQLLFLDREFAEALDPREDRTPVIRSNLLQIISQRMRGVSVPTGPQNAPQLAPTVDPLSMQSNAPRLEANQMRPEYDFSKAVRGKYYERYLESTNVVVLDPEVAKRFKNSTAVNEALRSLSPADSPTRTRRSARTRRQTSRR